MLQIKETVYGGRAYFATTHIASGTPVLTECPAIVTVYDDFKKEVCVYCFTYRGGSTLKYPVGDSSRACSTRCADLFLEGSGAREIQGLWDRIQKTKKKWGEAMNYDLLRFCAYATVVARCCPVLFETVLSLQDDHQSITDTERQSAKTVSAALNWLLPDSVVNFEALVDSMLGRSKCNCFGIWEQEEDGASFPESEMFGFALYPRSSYFNHACQPNVTKKRVDREMQFVAMSDVLDGEELTISYLGDREYSGVLERRAALREWGFDCMCGLCISQSAEHPT